MARFAFVMVALLAALPLIAATAARGERPLPALAGKKHFIRCVACHSVSAASRPMTGPHLEGIVGRKAASVEGFHYTKILRTQTFLWDEQRLDRWLKAPQADFAGLCLPFTGLAKPEDRAALIAYLKNPAPQNGDHKLTSATPPSGSEKDR
ncbi:MAG TPA: c-type cytochrome [Sphingobium sp.]|nr:c-type cytochrome [Sphingobium sp.]